jgi:hypothetical protein
MEQLEFPEPKIYKCLDYLEDPEGDIWVVYSLRLDYPPTILLRRPGLTQQQIYWAISRTYETLEGMPYPMPAVWHTTIGMLQLADDVQIEEIDRSCAVVLQVDPICAISYVEKLM